MSTLISVRSSGVANIATAPTPAASIVTTATETVSVRSDGDAVSVQGAPVETVIGIEPATLVLQIATTSVSVISVSSGGGAANVPATEIGQLLMSLDGVEFSAIQPVTSASEGWLVSADGDLLIEGAA
ncbi:MAG: hypothetical protein KAJ55_12085 [Anaerolineales bacterium]|nr:hypothetical protein [Anaerolineales bacterium]